jgi:hypothetical protein
MAQHATYIPPAAMFISTPRHTVLSGVSRKLLSSISTALTAPEFAHSSPIHRPFIAQIAKFSRKDVEVDLFRQFMGKDFPLHYVLFYADIRVKCSE